MCRGAPRRVIVVGLTDTSITNQRWRGLVAAAGPPHLHRRGHAPAGACRPTVTGWPGPPRR